MGKTLREVVRGLSSSGWFPGTHLFGKKDGSNVVLEPGELVNYGMLASSDQELNQSKAISFSDVFNNWKRIALIGRNPRANPEELDTWTYNSSLNQVVCTVNSVSTVGFISPARYDNYVFEVDISSTADDDDAIGICLAYIENGDGTCDSLMLYRQAGSNVQPSPTADKGIFAVIYNPDVDGVASTPSSRLVAYLPNPSLVYPDGSPAPALIPGNGLNGGWSTLGTIRLRVERTGSQIKVMTSNKGSTTYLAANTMTIDLNSAEYLQKFLLPCAVGFIAYSQENATFKPISQPGLTDPILDVRDNSLWTFNGTTWVKSTYDLTDATFVREGRLYKNPVTSGLYYVSSGYDFIRLV